MTTQEIDGNRVKVAAHVNRVFTADDVDTPDFLLAISLVRENLGQPHIVPTTQSVDDWLTDQIVSWELLPVGTGPKRVTLDTVAQRLGFTARPDRMAVLTERFEAMENTGYVAVIVAERAFVGTSDISTRTTSSSSRTSTTVTRCMSCTRIGRAAAASPV